MNLPSLVLLAGGGQGAGMRKLPDMLSNSERAYLETVFKHCNENYPSLEQLWSLMDEAWCRLDCDSAVIDERFEAFYSHPVWLLNGLFIEQDPESLANRSVFTDWVVSQKPIRVADYGGGHGKLARMIGEKCSDIAVEIVEPHPHPFAVNLAEQTPNVRYVKSLEGEYDILIATDVFEHVDDPIALVIQTAEFLRVGGSYLIANCFLPVIKCHLPQTFHMRYTWDSILMAIGLQPGRCVRYGRVFERSARLDEARGRALERRSRKLYALTKHLPARIANSVSQVLL